MIVMKRFLVTIIAVLYMASAMGATVHLHYCMGELVGAGFVHKERHKCPKCGMITTTGENGCCKDEHKTLKTSEHQLAKNTQEVKSLPAVLPVVFAGGYAPAFKTDNQERKISLFYSPPLNWRHWPIYILNCNFRI